MKDVYSLIWIEIRSDEGRKAWKQYKGEVVPVFILLDKKGDELFRQNGKPPSENSLLEMLNASGSISKK